MRWHTRSINCDFFNKSVSLNLSIKFDQETFADVSQPEKGLLFYLFYLTY